MWKFAFGVLTVTYEIVLRRPFWSKNYKLSENVETYSRFHGWRRRRPNVTKPCKYTYTMVCEVKQTALFSVIELNLILRFNICSFANFWFRGLLYLSFKRFNYFVQSCCFAKCHDKRLNCIGPYCRSARTPDQVYHCLQHIFLWIYLQFVLVFC